MKPICSLLSFVVISLLATSCATFPKNQLPKASGAAATGGKKVPLTYSISTGHNLFGSRTEGAAAQNEVSGKSLVAALDKSGRFSSVKQGKGGAVHLEVDMLNHGNGGLAMASGFISGFSMLTIPGVASDNYTLTATARSSGRSRKYVLDDGVTTVFWLPMILAMPFNYPGKVMPEVQENMYGNLIERMAKDGLLSGN
jgi:hypothetical protein